MPNFDEVSLILDLSDVFQGEALSAQRSLDLAKAAWGAGWRPYTPPQEFTAELVSPDDGISDGISRLDLVRAAINHDGEPRPGRETQVRYRGVDINLSEGIGDVFAQIGVDGEDFGVLHLTNPDDGSAVASWVRDIDFTVDMMRQDESA